jgi:LPXTG-site transpeptidase (sortase) family protein
MKKSKNNQKKSIRGETKRFLYFFVPVFLLVVFVFNFGVIYQNIKYYIDNFLPGKTKILGEAAIIKNMGSGYKEVKEKKVNTLLIPKISIEAPILVPNSRSERDMLDVLKNGVALYPNSALPGKKGTTIISGHSSPNLFSFGKYNTVFSLLNKLQYGDNIVIYYNQKKYDYKVIRKFTFAPNKEFSETEKNRSDLLLISCWPVGTNFKRIGVEAKFIK